MGLTIVHKSDLWTRKRDPRVALVLAGGAVTGGAYKLGGLKALDDFLVNRKTNDFDIYVGLSAGAFLAAPLAGGVNPVEMLRSIDGTSEDFSQLTALEFYRLLRRLRGVELYIVAMNLDTAERVVFGHDEDTSLTISEAVQASTALPGFYKPARLKGVDYVDGGVRRTANIDVAIEHGAELVICYNPFRPFHNRVVRRFVPEKGRYEIDGRPLASQGMLTVLNQVLRTLLHSRLVEHGE